jgi:integrase
MNKRGNNEGSIYFDKRLGLHRGALTLPDGRRRYVSGKTKRACRDKLRDMEGNVAAGLPVEDGDRLRTFLEWWIRTLEAKASAGSKSLNTVDNAKWAVDTWIEPELGSKRLRELTPEDVERLLSKMAGDGRSRRTVTRVRSYLGQALSVAERRGKVARNVARIAELPETKPPVERRALTPDEAKKVLEAASGRRLEALFVCALMLGLRPGELTGLRWSDVDLEAGTLQVSASLKSERGQLRIGATKTARSRRTVDLPKPVLVALRAHRKRQAAERLQAGSAWRALDLVFTTEIGTPIDPSNLRRTTKELCEAAGVEPVSPNELGRHSAASLLYDAGMPLDAIADLLGHASTRMLEQHYRHRSRTSFGAHVGPMEALFGG